MATNDRILIDRIISKLDIDNNIGETFENFAIEQILKEYDLSEEELYSGIVDGGNDGGIDGIFYFINSRLVYDIDKTDFPKTGVNFSVYIITCKHESSFKMVPINNMSTTLDEFFDLTIDNSELISVYNGDILSKRELLIEIYSRVAANIDSLNINLLYVSRGDLNELADNVKSKADYLIQNINKKFSLCDCRFHFLGSSELLEKYRKRKKLSSQIKCIDLINCDNSYLMLCNLKDYYNFIIDDDKKLKRYILDSNVRAYMGDNRVNKEIMKTLENKDSIEFWFLNNGITILSNKVTIIGKNVRIENVQIVNGLQTTETIYNYFSSISDEINENRNILIKVIESEDNLVRDEIIKSTNNQTAVELYSLKATDKIQRDIEDILLENDMYYERRINYYSNKGIEKTKIVTPLYLAYGYVSIVLKMPYRAIGLKSKFMNVKEQYEIVFSEKNPIKLWPIIANAMKKVEKLVEESRIKDNTISTVKYLKIMRSIVSFFTIAKILKKFDYTIEDLITFDINLLTDSLILDVITQIVEVEPDFSKLRKKGTFINLCSTFAEINNISNLQYILDLKNPFFTPLHFDLDEDFIQKVKMLLPPQPWPVGTHTKIAKELGEFTPKVSYAINQLITRGDFFRQSNGIVYDNDGNIIELQESK